MGLWKTFIKVWEVRTSVKFQESIEQSMLEAQKLAELNRNLPDIVNELDRVNTSWNKQIEIERNKNK
jgi:hypothetical protein